MSRLTASREPAGPYVVARSSPSTADDAPASPSTVHALQQQLAGLQREIDALRVQHQRDLATTRGLGEALHALRRGALALRTENEELRRRLSSRTPRRR